MIMKKTEEKKKIKEKSKINRMSVGKYYIGDLRHIIHHTSLYLYLMLSSLLKLPIDK